MFWNVDDKWNMTQPAEFLAFGAKCCGKKVWIANNFCVWWEGGGGGNDRIGWCYGFHLNFMQQSCKEVHVIIIRCFLFVC